MELKKKEQLPVNGIHLHYQIYGEGPDLVCLHGGGSDAFFDFEQMTSRLLDRFRMILVDLQNHGYSEHRDIPQTFEQDGIDTISLLDALGIGKASFFGFSNGATTVLGITCRYPHRVEKSIAASPVVSAAALPAGFHQMMQTARLSDMPVHLRTRFLSIQPDEALLQHMFEQDRQRMLAFPDMEPGGLQGITRPVLIIGGDQDVVAASHFGLLKDWIPLSRLLVLPSGHGHYMMADESGNLDTVLIDFTADQIARFLRMGA
ncbi:alpha/beta hydrolase [Niabella terrae]